MELYIVPNTISDVVEWSSLIRPTLKRNFLKGAAHEQVEERVCKRAKRMERIMRMVRSDLSAVKNDVHKESDTKQTWVDARIPYHHFGIHNTYVLEARA